MNRVNRVLILITALGAAACDQFPTEPSASAPVAESKMDNNGNGSQFAPNPFPGLGSFQDDEGRTCSIGWPDETDQGDFMRTGPKGNLNLHVNSSHAVVQVIDNGVVWDGVGNSAGIARYQLDQQGWELLNFTASAKVTNANGDEAQAVCHVQVRGVEFTKTDISVH